MGVGPEGDAQAEALPVGLVGPSRRCVFPWAEGLGWVSMTSLRKKIPCFGPIYLKEELPHFFTHKAPFY